MTTIALTVRDSGTMLRRNLRHMQRYPSLTFMLAGMPIIFLLLFVFVFGDTLGTGLGAGGRAGYLTYVVPGILMQTMASTVSGTSIGVAMDMTEGIVARFRTMAIARASVLTGHVLGSVIQGFIALIVVLAVALALGFRPGAGPLGWLGVLGLLAVTSFALTWVGVALGLLAKTVEEASNTPLPLVLLPFLGSGFVPAGSMPAGLRQFAEYQPFTPIMETLRSLLAGTPVDGSTALTAVAWCASLALAGYLGGRRLYNRDR
jgi:ABC-2 type transport system permease protein